MQETLKFESQYKTNPTDAPFEKKLNELLERLKSDVSLNRKPSPNSTGVWFKVNQNETDYQVTVETMTGDQSNGFRVDVKVEGRNGCSRKDAKAVFRSVEKALKDVFDVSHETA